MTKLFYARFNQYGSQSSIGFSNTFTAFAFETKKARDEWVAENCDNNLSIEPIKSAAAKKMVKHEIDRNWRKIWYFHCPLDGGYEIKS